MVEADKAEEDKVGLLVDFNLLDTGPQVETTSDEKDLLVGIKVPTPDLEITEGSFKV